MSKQQYSRKSSNCPPDLQRSLSIFARYTMGLVSIQRHCFKIHEQLLTVQEPCNCGSDQYPTSEPANLTATRNATATATVGPISFSPTNSANASSPYSANSTAPYGSGSGITAGPTAPSAFPSGYPSKPVNASIIPLTSVSGGVISLHTANVTGPWYNTLCPNNRTHIRTSIRSSS